MGWSCSEAAGKVVDLWVEMCSKSTGMSGTWEEKGVYYFFETSRREYADGHITGSIMRMLPNTPDGKVDLKADGSCKRAGAFHIRGDGTIGSGPAFLRKLAGEAATLTGAETSSRAYSARKL